MNEKNLNLLKKLINESAERISEKLKLNPKTFLSKVLLGNEILTEKAKDD
jgi:hypothetical protein